MLVTAGYAGVAALYNLRLMTNVGVCHIGCCASGFSGDGSHESMVDLFKRFAENAAFANSKYYELTQAIRAHGNFIENVPLMLVLVGLAEMNGLEKIYVHSILGLFMLGRVMHVHGMTSHFNSLGLGRINGFFGTVALFMAGAACNMWLLYKKMKIGVSRAPDRLFISSIVGNGTTAVSFSTKGYVRFGVEWHRDMTALTGARIPDISFAARAIGLFEVNSTYPDIKNNYGKKYRLDEGSFHWTPIVIQDPKPIDNTTGRIFIASTTGTSNDGMIVSISMQVATNSYNSSKGYTLRPNGIKFDFDVKSPPTYNMVPATASSWNLVLGFFSSSGNATLTTGNSLSDVAQRFDWPTWLMADGTNQTMSIVGGLNGTYPDGGFSPSFSSSKAQVNGSLYSDRQDDLDARCSQRAISFAIPYFAANLSIDPTIYVDETQAKTLAASGAFDTSYNTTTASNAAIPRYASTSALSLVVILVAMINLL
ncbi:hypothetical protein BSLG_003104 [Batrachochytrium salamandrivorans]|nr:hypothetical protein BSLG_003104 [Batrachochytrium salamandrivorans]